MLHLSSCPYGVSRVELRLKGAQQCPCRVSVRIEEADEQYITRSYSISNGIERVEMSLPHQNQISAVSLSGSHVSLAPTEGLREHFTLFRSVPGKLQIANALKIYQ